MQEGNLWILRDFTHEIITSWGNAVTNPLLLPCLMQPISWSRMFLQTTNKLKRLWNKSDAVKKVFHITSYLWGSPQPPPPVSLRIHHLPQASHKRQAQHSPLLPHADCRVQLGAETQQKRNSEGEKVGTSPFPGRKSQPRPTDYQVCWICYSDQGQLGFFLDKASPISQHFSRIYLKEFR